MNQALFETQSPQMTALSTHLWALVSAPQIPGSQEQGCVCTSPPRVTGAGLCPGHTGTAVNEDTPGHWAVWQWSHRSATSSALRVTCSTLNRAGNTQENSERIQGLPHAVQAPPEQQSKCSARPKARAPKPAALHQASLYLYQRLTRPCKTWILINTSLLFLETRDLLKYSETKRKRIIFKMHCISMNWLLSLLLIVLCIFIW